MAKGKSVCVVGCGFISGLHARGWTMVDNVDLYTCDVDEAAAKWLADTYGAKGFYTDFDAVLGEKKIDVVDLCVPHHLHEGMVSSAAAAGKNILLEKPIARDLAEAGRLSKAASDAGVRLMIAECWEYYRPMMAARTRLEQKAIGDIFLATVHDSFFFQPPGWRAKKGEMGGGALLDRGIHLIHVLRSMLGEVKNIHARTSDKAVAAMQGEDTALLSMEFESGAVGEMICSYGTHQVVDVPLFSVYGTGGTLFDHGGLHEYLFYPMRSYLGPGWANGGPAPTSDGPKLMEPTMIADMIADFAQRLDTGDSFLVTPESATKDLEIVIAAYQSAESGKPVNLPLG